LEEQWGNYNNGQDRFKQQSEIVRYFIQGLPFALLSIGFIGMLDIVFFITFPSNFADIISAMIVLSIFVVILMGALNSVLAAALWDIRPRQTCTSFAGQGALFAIMTYLFDPFFLLFLLPISMTVYSDIVFYMVAFLILSLVGGYFGKHIAAEFEGEYEKTEELASVHDRFVTCPHCGQHSVTGPTGVDDQKGTLCSSCGRWFGVFDRGPGLQ
jgi:hypothetical protein